VTEEEMQNAIKPIANIFVVIKAITKLRRHSRSLSKDAAASVLASSDSDTSSNERAKNTRADSLSVPVHEDNEEEESNN